ncbi:MAG: acetamidase/formamidase family protein [Dehalococcoidia bacterium]|nr:acetamidase/formamidase family protein [Dehalococcoidia bacterium]
MQHVPLDRNFGRATNYAFDARTPPVLRVRQDEEFTAELQDTYNGVLRGNPELLQPADMAPYTDHQPFWYNPVCGPVYVEGAEKGDVLAVQILEVSGITAGSVATVPRAHHFAGLRGWEEVDEPFTGVVRNEGGACAFDYGGRSYRWNARPFLGTIATAPEYEVLATLPTSFGSIMAAGGNLDCCAIGPGATVYLQAMNEGGLLFLGDMHASQGDGELCGVANEVSGTVRLKCQVLKQQWLRNVRVENDESLISLYCFRPVEEAMRQAVRDLILWLEHDFGLARRESYLLISMCPDFHLRTYQLCSGLGRLMTTVGAEFPKYLLGM